MGNNLWERFAVKVKIDTAMERVYDAWAIPARLEDWFLRDATFANSEGLPRGKGEYIQVGDTYRWLWFGHGDDVFEEGEVLELDGSSFIRFTFSGCLVTVELSLLDGVVLVELIQEEIPPEDDPEKNLYVQCSIGWTYYLTILKSVLEGGLDLRDKD